MASTVLPNGIIIPEKYSRDWYADLYHNWQELDNLLGGGTPKDGTLTIQQNGSTVGTFSANQSTNETVNIEVPDVNDATLTIQKNGTDVATFSANASTNATANIEVPTKTSDLTNDSNFVQSSDLATVATSGNYNDLSNKPTIPTVNNATLTIQKNGTNVQTFTANQSTNATANITVPTKTSDLTNDSGFITEDNTKIPLAGSNAISGSLIPSTDGTVNLGGSSYQWNNAYIKSLTINGVACGDILTHNVSEFVDVSSNQDIGGIKTFSAGLFASKSTAGDLVTLTDLSINSTNEDANGMPLTGHTNSIKIKGSQFNVIPCMLTGQVFASGNTSAELRVYKYKDTSRMASFNIHYTYSNDTAVAQFINCNISTNVDGLYNIGSSARRFNTAYVKAINGLNPGALSLPSGAYIDIDTTNWDLTCQNELLGSFTPTADGWLMLHVANSGTSEVNFWVIGGVIRINNKSTLNTTDNNNFNMITIPVEKDVTYNIYGNASEYVAGRSIAYCRFMPCRGNV